MAPNPNRIRKKDCPGGQWPADFPWHLCGEPGCRSGYLGSIWACLLVIFTCFWTVLHLNIAAPSDGFRTKLFRKLRWAASAVFAPEILTLRFACKRSASLASTQYLRAQACSDWPNSHTFYAESVGFISTTEMELITARTGSVRSARIALRRLLAESMDLQRRFWSTKKSRR